MIKEQLAALYRRNRLLTAVGWIHFGLFIVALLISLVDDRQVLGINTWVKPMKFMFSLTVYLWTIAWFSEYINRPRWRIRTISVIIAAALVIESACLFVQAGRATTSHFNIATDFDASIFTTMGIMIGIDLFMTVIIFFMFTKPRTSMEPVYLWSIRLGILIFLAGGLIGYVMILNNAHTIGAADGGPGLVLLNWSSTAGDLRIAHGLALHAMQFVPLVGFYIGSSIKIPNLPLRYIALGTFVAAYSLAIYTTFHQAMAGQPLF